MDLSLKQDFAYQGENWWHWWVWVEGPDEELDAIDHVTYILHPTFPQPVRTIRDRASKFRLETAGWGVFRIGARVARKDGTTLPLEHDLELLYPDGRRCTA